ncbi:D-alanyl-D-alanine carboxypeptidase DacD precursor [Aquisphaera giovannonii]|uniref:D-alanyl-D-alanine carboxypeptidase DacD n=1 Tax=Aquisphaera giovannonii TaxID=406548 RepID=A0A5B9WD35_9BACT|nr:peptidoglycan-binding protein [Aquisphaera giovannonii]QEH38482.1 D-alanyl-D-alanine carboxypeptidase DacD precursor [Aquisphaera giovannonii]
MQRSAILRVFHGLVISTALLAAASALGQTPALKLGDEGPAVETLQRLLNARLKPSPGLEVDGDFGNGTQSALQRFQKEKGLPETGRADPGTWSALGTLGPAEGADPPVPAPEVVNAEKAAKKPADPLDGPPFTTAKAWAVADGRTGRLILGHEAETPLEMASTTKMMTALLVARLAADDPKALGEAIVFSRRADRTPGSTSGVREGESVKAGELLYGLLLPSGNDAATAFAEHFGGRFAPPEGSPGEADPLARFVAEMNRAAKSLGLGRTHFANPHGLPAKGHHASAADLAVLAAAVVADPTLAGVVSTPRRGAALEGPDSKSRNVVWTNTNRLLDTEGYDGVKTGTTNGAGNCLVASGHRGERRRIVVILGAPSSDGRYADARNLFRWAWKQP